MHPDETLRCEDCGQITKIEKVGTLTAHSARYCPYCGSDQLTQVKSSFVALEARCFSGVDRTLVQLLLETWVRPEEGDPDLKLTHTFFIDYLKIVLEVKDGR